MALQEVKPCNHTRGGKRADGTEICIKCREVLSALAPDHEPVGQMLNSIVSTLDIIAGMALRPETAAEVAAEEVRLGQIAFRAQLILSFADARHPSRTRGLRRWRDYLTNRVKIRVVQ